MGQDDLAKCWSGSRTGTASGNVVGGKKEADELFFIKLSCGSTVLLPEEGNAHDNHDHPVDYRGDDGRGPDGLLVTLGRHGEVEDEQSAVLMLIDFALQRLGESIAGSWYCLSKIGLDL